MSENGKYRLELTTKIQPAEKFTVDGEEFEMLGLAHLSKEDEAKAMARFARYEHITFQLAQAKDDNTAERLARKLQDLRRDLFTTLTTMDAGTVDRLPVTAQTQLIAALQEELLGEADEAGIDLSGAFD